MSIQGLQDIFQGAQKDQVIHPTQFKKRGTGILYFASYTNPSLFQMHKKETKLFHILYVSAKHVLYIAANEKKKNT